MSMASFLMVLLCFIDIWKPDGHFGDDFFQQSEESSQFREEYEMRKLKQACNSFNPLQFFVVTLYYGFSVNSFTDTAVILILT